MPSFFRFFSNSKNKDKQKNASIESELKKNKKESDCRLRVLLLGAGGSGKTTILKQFKSVHGLKPTLKDLYGIVPGIRRNLLEGMVEICRQNVDFIDKKRCKRVNPKLEKLRDQFANIRVPINPIVTQKQISAFRCLWEDPSLRETFKLCAQTYILENFEYFLLRADMVIQKDYCPSFDDFLRCRVRSTGVVQQELDISIPPELRLNKAETQKWEFFDVGGQRNERKKWIHIFDNVNVIIFVVALSGYAQICFEDGVTNRLHESIELFKNLSNLDYFSSVPIVVIFNKLDIFREKILETPITAACPDYKGDPHNEALVLKFLIEKYEKVVHESRYEKRIVTAHVVTAIDTDCMRITFNSIRTGILQNVLSDLWLI